MGVPRSFLEGFIMFLFMIPIAVYYIVKWIIKGIAILIIAIKN